MIQTAQSLRLVRPRTARRRVVGVVLGFLTLVGLILWLVPWQQTVMGSGQVMVLSAMDRPQSVEALIPARIVEWRVQEGQTVKRGQVLALLEDLDSKFLDAQQPKRLREQREYAILTQRESAQRVTELERQRTNLVEARESALGAARQAIRQAEARERASRELVRQADRNVAIASRVAVRSAEERAAQAGDRVAQALQALQAARQQAETMRLRLDRIAELERNGLRSKQDLEFAQNDHLKATTEVERASKAVEIARRDARVGGLSQDQALLETERARAALDQARANLDVAVREVVDAKLNLSRLESDTAASLARVAADVQSARESMAKNGGDLQKVENELGNLQRRTGQQTVVAPCDGRIVRLLQVGAGATVKSGDQLAIVAPETSDRAVEIYVSDNDVPLVSVGRPVRLQFAGWPAVQMGGLPSAAVGTFGGRVAFIDPVDDGTARFRIVIKPDRHTWASGRKDPPWPGGHLLRPGAEAMGWVMLDRVPLGVELWRQFNGFPPRAPRPTLSEKKTKEGTEPKATKSKDPQIGPIKLKTKS